MKKPEYYILNGYFTMYRYAYYHGLHGVDSEEIALNFKNNLII